MEQKEETKGLFPFPDLEMKLGEAGKAPVTSEDIKANKPPIRSGKINPESSDPYCVRCGDEIMDSDLVTYQGMTFHKECTPFAPVTRPASPPIMVERKVFEDVEGQEMPIIKTIKVPVGGSSAITFTPKDLHTNPRIDMKVSLRASELARLIEVIEVDETLKEVHDKMADILCEFGNLYVRCAHCGKVTIMGVTSTAVGGVHTRKVKDETGAVITVMTGKFYSKIRSVEVFCSEACDLNYSKKLREVWEKEQEEKKAAKTPAGKITNALDEAFKKAKKDPRLAAKLADLLVEFCTPKEEKK